MRIGKIIQKWLTFFYPKQIKGTQVSDWSSTRNYVGTAF